MKTTRYLPIALAMVGLMGCVTIPEKPSEETAKSEPLPLVDPFALVTSETKTYWEKRNAEDTAADEAERAQQTRRGS